MPRLILTIIAVVLLLGAVSGFYFFRLALNRRSNKKSALRALPSNAKKTDKSTSFLERSACENWYIDSFDGLKLHAFFIENNSDRFVIIQHGYMSRAKHMEKIAEFFNNEGFGVLIPDARAHGESEGKYIGMGWNDRLDILSWAAKLSAERPNTNIFAKYDLHMGDAAKSLNAAKLPIISFMDVKDSFVPFYMLDIVYRAAVTSKNGSILFQTLNTRGRLRPTVTATRQYFGSLSAKYFRTKALSLPGNDRFPEFRDISTPRKYSS